MTALVKLRYVGFKPVAIDNISRTGITWNGNGDVQEVPAHAAKALLKFPDQWELASPGDLPILTAPEVIRVTDEDGDQVIVDQRDMSKPLERMSKAELKAFAMHRYGKELDLRRPTKMLIDQIEELEGDIDAKHNKT
jgi:hypothetical protein